MLKTYGLQLLFVSMTFIACSLYDQGQKMDEALNPHSQQETVMISAQTILPEKFESKDYLSNQRLIVPSYTLQVSSIKRPRVELRKGPNVRYELLPVLARSGTEVILFDRFDAWQKIYIPEQEITGWVHADTLSKPSSNRRQIEIPAQKLPVVTAIRDIRNAYSLRSLQTVALNIPKGSVFITLKRKHRRALVWLEQTNSLVWLSLLDVQ